MDTIQSCYEDAATVLEELPRIDVMSTLERDDAQGFVDSWNELFSDLRAALRAERERRHRMQPK
jgi:hypothetical protein